MRRDWPWLASALWLASCAPATDNVSPGPGAPLADRGAAADSKSDAGETTDLGARPGGDVPEDWPRVRGNCGVGLRGPAVIAFSAEGTDSCVGGFQTSQCVYHLDLGAFSDSLALEGVAAAFETVRIDGRAARLATWTTDQSYFVGVHVFSVWDDAPGVSLTIVARCGSSSAQTTARLTLLTVQLPPDAAGAAVPLEPTAACTGYDERPIEGYRLGRSCVDGKTGVPGVCAVGARTSNSSGTGEMVCFVSAQGEYFWAFVKYGEYIVGTASRHGPGALARTQLSEAEMEHCREGVVLLETADAGVRDRISGEYSYGSCP